MICIFDLNLDVSAMEYFKKETESQLVLITVIITKSMHC